MNYRVTLADQPGAGEREKPRRWFIFSGQKLLVKPTVAGWDVPWSADMPDFFPSGLLLGDMAGVACFAAEWPQDAALPPGIVAERLRSLYGKLDREFFKIAGSALHLLAWEKTNRYCGQCGQALTNKADERAKMCMACGHIVYPRISPAMIVAVVKGDQLLLAQSQKYADTKIHSVLAGYLEIGETLEECVAREVWEETQLEITEIRYFGSQPWPYSTSVMIGFTARYKSGTLRIDPSELVTAAWFDAEHLPQISEWGSIARELIEWFRHSGSIAEKYPCQINDTMIDEADSINGGGGIPHY